MMATENLRPGRLKVLLGAMRVIVRSAISGSSEAMGTCGAPEKASSQWISSAQIDEPAPEADLGHARELVAREHAADGIVRVAEEEHARPLPDRGLEAIEVDRVAAVPPLRELHPRRR